MVQGTLAVGKQCMGPWTQPSERQGEEAAAGVPFCPWKSGFQ